MIVLLYTLPALALLVALWLGHYPAEGLRLRLAGVRRRARRAIAAVPSPRNLLFARPRLPRGGALLGAALAGRAPPSAPRAALAARVDDNREERIQMKAKKLVPAALLALALLAPAAAQAHVTLQPNEAPEGAYTVLDVRVPNESDSENTTKVAVQFPEGFGDVSYQAVPGWNVKVVHQKLKKPIQTDDGPVTEGVREVIFSGGKLPPGQFQDFPLSLQIPGKVGEELTFKAVQTYEKEVVRWIGAPETEHPAPQVLVLPPKEPGAAATVNNKDLELESTGSGESSSGGSGDKGLAIAALVVAVISLLVAAAAVLGSRRRAA
ncbi:MAG TPA: YcnI family protein [Solirubrobacterales bacterium]|nr:YcnI family protein [Solirubrobacterales bacterium]